MGDLADLAQAQSERIEELRLKNHRLQDKNAPFPTGVCIYCGEPVTEGLRWCDQECRDDWEYMTTMRQRQKL